MRKNRAQKFKIIKYFEFPHSQEKGRNFKPFNVVLYPAFYKYPCTRYISLNLPSFEAVFVLKGVS